MQGTMLQNVPKKLRGVLMVTGPVLLTVWVVQLAYPRSRALPFVTVAEKNMGFASEQTVASRLASQYKNVPLSLVLPDKTVKTSYVKVGFSVDTQRAVHEATAYPVWQRIIPFSLLAKGATTDVRVYMKPDTIRYDEFAKTVLASCRRDPVNAGVQVVEGSVVLAPAKDGYACDTTKLAKLLATKALSGKQPIVTVPLTKESPARTDRDVEPLLNTARRTLERRLILQASDGAKEVPKSQLAAWLQFSEKQDGKLALALNAEQVSTYLKTAHASLRVAPKPTVVTTLDGVETGRTSGAPGKEVDEAKTAANVQKSWLESSSKEAVATVILRDVAPGVAYSRSYSPTEAGLQALVNEIARDKGDYAIALRRSNGTTTQVNGTKQYHPASTYKMYVAWVVLKNIESGQMKWSDPAESGKTVEQCFDAMIVNSDNPCGEWFGLKIGWTNLNNQLKGIGLTCTNLSTAWVSCASDETLFLSKLESGQLLSGASQGRLLDVMKRQVYRSGIPAGVGVPVADKVGFIDGYLHDAAIVYSPKGTYELTIMTRGSSWAQIADAARQINAQIQRM